MGATAEAAKNVGRNDLCPCGSGKKYKHCCESKAARGQPPEGATGRKRHGLTPIELQRLRALYLETKRHSDAGRRTELILTFREIVRLDPNNPGVHYDFGGVLLQCGLPAEAAASLRRAIELRPRFEGALQRLVEAAEEDGRESEALAACRKLSRIATDPIERRFYSAKALAIEGATAEAMTELRRVVFVAPRHDRALRFLGTLLSQRGMFEEAAHHLTAAIDLAPSAFELLTRAKRMTDDDRPLIDRMRLTAERSDIGAMERSSVRFALGKAFDDLGEHAEAMRQYEEGNRLRSMSARLDRAKLTSSYDNLIATFTSEAVSHALESMARPAQGDRQLPAFIVGMPRSGTTLVEQILSSHPAVVGGGELTFWNDRLNAWYASGNSSVALGEAEADYRAIMQTIGPEARLVTNKMPENFVLLWLICLALPEARVIHCRRHPIDTCLSIFFANFRGMHDYAWDRGDLVFYYRQYERLMEHWRRVLPADRFIEVDYESLIADREAETRRLVAFCGLEWNDTCLSPERNERPVKTASLWQARQPVYKTSVERWRYYEPWLGELRELLPAAETPAS